MSFGKPNLTGFFHLLQGLRIPLFLLPRLRAQHAIEGIVNLGLREPHLVDDDALEDL